MGLSISSYSLVLGYFRDIYFCGFDAISYEPMERISLGWLFLYFICVFLAGELYNYIMKSRLSVFFVKLGNYSYEVFLFQMLVFSLISEKRFFFIENEVFRNIVYVLTTIVFSIVPVLVYKEYIKKLYVRWPNCRKWK